MINLIGNLTHFNPSKTFIINFNFFVIILVFPNLIQIYLIFNPIDFH